MKKKTVLNWSSGKDAALACWMLQQSQQYEIVQLLTTVSGETDRVLMHGVRADIVDRQAEAMGLSLRKIMLPAAPDDVLYRQAMQQAMDELKADGIVASAFGDIFLEDLRRYREAQLVQAGIEAVFPLWGKDTAMLVQQIEDAGIRAMIVCVNEKYLGREFLGMEIGRRFLDVLPPGVDPCGENGEFHTLVTDAPFFIAPLPVRTGEIVYKKYAPSGEDAWDTGFYFLDCRI